MPTGYTCDIERGQSFEDFVLGCARAFGACVMQRDDPASDKPKLREESNYYSERLAELKSELAKLEAMTLSGQIEYGNALRDEDLTSYAKQISDKNTLRVKYDDMLLKVRMWHPPTNEHIELKNFMIKQLQDSIDFDCNTKYVEEELEKALSWSPMDYYNDRVDRLKSWNIPHFTEQLKKEQERVNGANDWILKLYDSLGIEFNAQKVADV